MSKARQEPKATPTRAQARKYRLRLFVAGDEPNSKRARENLAQICEQHLAGRYETEIVDVLDDFEAALKSSVLVTPALVLVAPAPTVTIVGNLSDRKKVLAALRLAEDE